MSFYASQFNNKSSRYCSSNLYGSNLSTVYADGPPPLDDTLEEDDGEIVFRDKNPKKDSPDSKLDSDKSGTVSGETDFNPWSKNDQKDVADDDFGDFSGFADFSSAFGGNSKSQNDSSWFKNGDNDHSSVTNFNHDFPSHQGKISSSSHKTVEKNEGKTSKDDDFGCFSGGDDSDFDDFGSFTSNNQNTNTEKTEEINGSKDSQVSEDSQSKKTTNSDELFKNDKTVHGSNNSLGQNTKKSNFGSADDFDEFGSVEGGPTLNGSSTSPTNNSSTSNAQNVTSDTHSAMKPTCFSDDDDDFGDFSSSSFDDERGETTKSPDLIINANEIQNTHINESSSLQSSRDIESEHTCNPKESEDSDETVPLPQYDGSETSTKKYGEDIDISEDNDFTSTDQSKENISNDDDEFGEFSASGSSVTKTEEIKSKELPSINNINDDDDDFGEFGVGSPPSLPSLHDDADDDFGEFGAVAAPTKENEKKDDNDDGFGDLGAASPPSLPSPNGNSHNDDDDDEFGDFSSTAVPTPSSTEEKPKNDKEGNDDDFGDFGAVFPTQRSDLHGNSDNEFGDFGVAISSSTTEEKPKGDDDDEFGSVLTTAKNDHHDNATATADDDDDDEFGDFDSAPATIKPDFQSDKGAAAAVDDEFGEFGPAPTTTKIDHQDNTAAADDDDDDFGGFGAAPATSKADLHDNNDDGDFGDFGVTLPPSKQNKDDDFGDFAEVEQSNSKESKPKSTSEPSSLEPKMPPPNDDDDEFGQFDSVPSKSSDSGFADFQSSDNTSKGFADFSSVPQTSMPSSFHTTKDSQSFSNKDVQHGQPSKVTGSTSVIKPQRRTNPDRLENAIKDCFSNKDVTIESHIIIQKIEHETKSERCSAWQQLLTTERDGSLRFDWVLSEHQVKMLEGLSMVPVKIQTSVSFKPKAQVPPPLFASSMGLLEPVKGVITPFHHIEEINPSQDPFGAPPEVGVQDLGFGKGSKKETPVFPTETKDNTSDTVSVSSSLDLDFLAPSSTNGESTKTESRGLFEDDLLGLGMFSEPSPSPKITNGKNIFKFNNTTIPLATNEGNLSEQARTVIKDFEDLSFMLSKVLMFPLKSKE